MKSFISFILALSISLPAYSNRCAQIHQAYGRSWDQSHLEELFNHIREDLVLASPGKLPAEIELVLSRAKQKFWLRNTHPERVDLLKNLDELSLDIYQLFYKESFVAGLKIYPARDHRLHRWLRQQVIRNSLENFSARNKAEFEFSKSARLRANIRKALGFLDKLNGFPVGLPKINNKPVPKELLEKILVDGHEAHRLEIERAYSPQQRRDIYIAVSKVYKVIALMVVISIAADRFQDNKEHTDELVQEQKQQVFQELDDLNTSLDQLDASLDQILERQGDET